MSSKHTHRKLFLYDSRFKLHQNAEFTFVLIYAYLKTVYSNVTRLKNTAERLFAIGSCVGIFFKNRIVFTGTKNVQC